jgi:DNA (cytosine-5)-methyltransferase 1
MARLHGFPDWFRFHETKWHGARQIGNAVPPPLSRAVAESIIEVLECKRERPSDAIALGDPALLRIGMAEAAAYWGVNVPIGRRDRKSGTKKRSQAEIEATRFVLSG